jgi:hypothetical protein
VKEDLPTDDTILFRPFLNLKLSILGVFAGYALVVVLSGLSLLFAFSILELIQGVPPLTDSVNQPTAGTSELRATRAPVGMGVVFRAIYWLWRPCVWR